MKSRNSNIEILRIISMILIVCSHFSIHGFKSNIIYNNIFLDFIYLGNIGVMIFSIISGYVMFDNKYDRKNMLKIICVTNFYSILMYLIFNYKNIRLIELIKNLFPIIFNKYWYITYYLILFFIIPYLNIVIKKLNRKENVQLLGILIIMFYFIPTFTNYFYDVSKLIYLIIGYLIGATIKKYGFILDFKKIKFILFITIFVILSSIIVFETINLTNHSKYLLGISKLSVLIISICLFYIFISKKSFSNKTINNIGSMMLSVYIISDNENVRNLLWKKIFYLRNIENIFLFIVYTIFSILAVFGICIIIEIARKRILEKRLMKLYGKIYNSLEIFINSLIRFFKSTFIRNLKK